MGTGNHASQHWAVGVWSNDRGITHHGKGGPPKHELLLLAASGASAGTDSPVGLFPATNPHSHWLEVLQAKAFMALTWGRGIWTMSFTMCDMLVIESETLIAFASILCMLLALKGTYRMGDVWKVCFL